MPKTLIVMFLGTLLAAAGTALWLTRETPVNAAGMTTEGAGASYAAVLATTFPDMDGRPQSLGQWQGKLLFINFWATWCGPCKEEMPIFESIFRQNAAKGVQIVGIAADNVDNVRAFQSRMPISYPLLPDSNGAMAFSRRMGNRLGMLPHTLVFSPTGELILNKIGPLSESEMAFIVSENLPGADNKRQNSRK